MAMETIVQPPLVDLCARLREPGHQSHGTLKSRRRRGSKKKRFLHVVIPPDTNPALEKWLVTGRFASGLIKMVVSICMYWGRWPQVLKVKTRQYAWAEARWHHWVSNARRKFANDDVLLQALDYAATYDIKVFTLMNPVYPKNYGVAMMAILHLITAFRDSFGLLKPWRYPKLSWLSKKQAYRHILVSDHQIIDWLDSLGETKGLAGDLWCGDAQLHLTDDALIGFNALAYVLPPCVPIQIKKFLRCKKVCKMANYRCDL